jgi:hypothetical protein
MQIDIIDAFRHFDAVCVTTNGEVTQRGRGVMGRGTAKVISMAYPEAEAVLGANLRAHGNVPSILGYWGEQAGFKEQWDKLHTKPLWSFPVKHSWRNQADIRLIRQSAKLLDWEMRRFFLQHPAFRVALPRPGCSNGGLSWDSVKTYIEPILDDHYTVIDRVATVSPSR